LEQVALILTEQDFQQLAKVSMSLTTASQPRLAANTLGPSSSPSYLGRGRNCRNRLADDPSILTCRQLAGKGCNIHSSKKTMATAIFIAVPTSWLVIIISTIAAKANESV